MRNNTIIKIKDLHTLYMDTTFELFIRDKQTINMNGKLVSKLKVEVNSKTYYIWEPKNKVWAEFAPQLGMGLICKVEHYSDRYFIKPIEQLLVIGDKPVYDLFELPFEDGDNLILGIGVVSTKNKTQYVLLLDDKRTYLIRTPANWEVDIQKLQYSILDISYRRTTQKGFLAINEKIGDLGPEDINRLFN